MTQMGLFWCPKQVSSCSSSSGGRGAVAPATSRRHGDRSCGIGRLMRRLKKQSKMPCSVWRTATLPCQYDPLSYARNFDRTGFDDDSAQFSYTFSSRFVAPVTISDGRPQLPAASL